MAIVRIKQGIGKMSWLTKFVLICVGALFAVLALVWLFNGLNGLGLSTHGVIALVLGITISMGLGVGLMALVFYSNRSGQDVVVDGAGQGRHDRPRE